MQLKCELFEKNKAYGIICVNDIIGSVWYEIIVF